MKTPVKQPQTSISSSTQNTTRPPKAINYLRYSHAKSSVENFGDSERRQIEECRAWCQRNRITLDENIVIDRALPAYRGQNSQIGKLKTLLEQIKRGDLQEGDYIIAERIDRITRRETYDGLKIIEQILDYGLKLVTTFDNTIYSRELINKHEYLMHQLTGQLSLANRESADKAKRIHEKWNYRRDAAKNGIKLKSKCPSWLQWDENKRDYVKIESRANTIKYIYDLYLGGMGQITIMKKLISEKVPSFGSSDSWTVYYLQKILAAIETTGRKQFFVQNDENKKTKIGEVIENYYPRIISDEDFARVEELRKNAPYASGDRKGSNSGEGRKALLPNLFTKIVFCQQCGAAMFHHSHSYYSRKKDENGKNIALGKKHYLRCYNAWRYDCPQKISWPYEHFERWILEFVVNNLDLNLLLGKGTNQAELTKLNGKIILERQGLVDVEKKLNNLIDALEDAPKSARQNIYIKMESLEKDKAAIQARINKLQQQYTAMNADSSELGQRVEEIKQTASRVLKNRSDLDLRKKIRVQLVGLVDRIVVAPSGHIMTEEEIDLSIENQLKGLPKLSAKKKKAFADKQRETHLNYKPSAIDRICVIYFKSGAKKILTSDFADVNKIELYYDSIENEKKRKQIEAETRKRIK